MRWDMALDAELINLYNTYLNGAVIFANKYGISAPGARYRLGKLGIKVRGKSESHKGIALGEKHPQWKGGKYINDNGYVMIYVGNHKYKPEHILVMEKLLGRKLKINEMVHHIDETFEARSNNDPGNLQLTTRGLHTKHHLEKGYSISFNKRDNKHMLRVNKDSKRCYVGKYSTRKEALYVLSNRFGIVGE
jgi:hypothetical protein